MPPPRRWHPFTGRCGDVYVILTIDRHDNFNALIARAQRRAAQYEGLTDLHQITPYGLANSHDDAAESWSPDGKKILFAGIHERFNGGSLYVVHTDGTGLRAIALQTGGSYSLAFAPGWSPDGSKIIFSLFTRTAPGTGNEGIYIANADGSDVTAVASGGFYDNADWGTHGLAP